MGKIWGLAFQKVAKTGNIGKKSPVASGIDCESYLSMQKVNRTHLIVFTIIVITAGHLNVKADIYAYSLSGMAQPCDINL